MSNEIWKDVLGYEGLYQVSNTGKVKSLPKSWVSGNGVLKSHSGKILNTSISRGYYRVPLNKDGVKKLFTVHRLVAMAFTLNAENLETVNHKDGNKLNNNVDNLEWMSSGDNTRHAHLNGLTKQGGKHQWAKIVLDTETGIYYETLNEAASSKNINVSTLSNYLTGKIKTNRTSLMYV